MSMSVCLSVCPHIYQETNVRTLPNYLCLLPVDRFFAGGVVIRYVLPVSWMTSCFFL